MSSKTEKNLKKAIVILSALLLVSVCLLIGILIYYERIAPSVITDQKITTRETGTEARISIRKTNILTAARTAEHARTEGTLWKTSDSFILKLYKGQNYDETAFAVSNMFPGDALYKEYLVQVSHRGAITVNFTANVRPSSDPEGSRLEEVLMCKVEANGQRLYEGLMRNMPETLEYTTDNTARAATTEIPYKITAYLDGPSVGNAHMNKGLIADFQWWVMVDPKDDDDDHDDSGSTSQGDKVEKPLEENRDEITDLDVKGETEEITDEDYGVLVLPATGDTTQWLPYAFGMVGSFLILLLLAKKRKEENYD